MGSATAAVRATLVLVALGATTMEAYVRVRYPEASLPGPVVGTAPAGAPLTATLLVVGDSGSGSPEWRETRRAMAGESALLAIHTGDVSYRTPEEYRRFVADAADLPFPLLVVAGDHDRDMDRDLVAFRRAFGGGLRREDVGPVRVLLLDSGRENLGKRALDFVEAEATAWRREVDAAAARGVRPPQPWCVVVSHVPPWQPDHRFPEGLGKGHGFSDVAAARRLISILAGNRVSLLACGHWHGYAFDDRAGFPMVVSGGGGKDVEPGHDFHYARVTLGEETRVEQVVTARGHNAGEPGRWGDSLLARWLVAGAWITAGAWVAAAVALVAFRRRGTGRAVAPGAARDGTGEVRA